jgi:hypothetical protein
MFYAVGPFANPHIVDPVCLQDVDFPTVLMQVKAEDATDIPLEEYFKYHSGLGAYARVSITDIGAMDEDSDSDDSEPCSPDPGNAAQLGGALVLGNTPSPHGAPPAPAMGAADGPALAQTGGLDASGPPQDSTSPGAPEHMSVRDILPVPVGRLRGSTIIPSVEARLLLVKPDTVDITLHAGSFYEIRITGPNNYVGVYRVPLQPAHSGLCGDQGMLVVNLCSASIGFLHQVYNVGAGNYMVFFVDPICSGDDSALPLSIPLKDAARLCDGAPLPRGFRGVGVLLVPEMGYPTRVAPSSPAAMVDHVLPGVLEDPAPLNAALEDPVLLAMPIAATSPESALSCGSLDLDFGVLPCNSLELTAVNNDAEHVVTSAVIPLPPSPPPVASLPQEPTIDLHCHEDIDDFL